MGEGLGFMTIQGADKIFRKGDGSVGGRVRDLQEVDLAPWLSSGQITIDSHVGGWIKAKVVQSIEFSNKRIVKEAFEKGGSCVWD